MKMDYAVARGLGLMLLMVGSVLGTDPETKAAPEAVPNTPEAVPSTPEVVKVLPDGREEPVLQYREKTTAVTQPLPSAKLQLPPVPVPAPVEETNSLSQVIGNLVTKLVQAPVALINAVARAISRLTGTRPIPYR